jgi:pyruvate dehydrogenase E2 component (dihydrolipoamide acetyltransferase)
MVQVGQPVVVIVEDKDTVPAFASYTVDDAQSGPSPSSGSPAPAPDAQSKAAPAPATKAARSMPVAPVAGGRGVRVVSSPYARQIAREANVSLQSVSGSGPGGRVTAADVQHALASGGIIAAPGSGSSAMSDGAFAEYTDVEVTQIKKVTARRLLESKTSVPHYYLSVECNVDVLLLLRTTLNTLIEKEGVKVSINDFVIKAAAAALKKVPEVNAAWHGAFIRQYGNVDIMVAVQTAAGLMVPVVRDADLKGLSAISSEVKDLAGKVSFFLCLNIMCWHLSTVLFVHCSFWSATCQLPSPAMSACQVVYDGGMEACGADCTALGCRRRQVNWHLMSSRAAPSRSPTSACLVSQPSLPSSTHPKPRSLHAEAR